MYSLENAKKFGWSSVSGKLNSERLSHLEKYLVGSKILDAGCGGGAYVEFLSKKELDVTGIEKHDNFFEFAQNNNSLGTYIQGDISCLPFSDNSFDCTYCFDVLEHVDDWLALKEVRRVTQKRIIVTVPKEDEVMQKYNLTFLHYRDKTHLRNYTYDSLSSLLNKLQPRSIEIFPELFVPLKSLIFDTVSNAEGSEDNSMKKKAVNFLLGQIIDSIEVVKIPTSLVGVACF